MSTAVLSNLTFSGYFWMPRPVQSSKIFYTIMQKPKMLTGFLKIFGWKNTTVSEQCCHNAKRLAQELSRKERILRNTLRFISTTSISKWQANDRPIKAKLVKDLIAHGGIGTMELYSRSVSLWGLWSLWRTAPSPNTVLSEKDPQPADCWAFSGSRGTLHILLPYPQQLHGILVEHIKPDTANSAPKEFELLGVLHNNTRLSLLKEKYVKNGTRKQFYHIQCDDVINEVVFKVMSNQGNKEYTCIYRIHLYGSI